MGFALIGVVAMQLYFLRQSYDMQSKLFDRSVNEALNNVVSKLSKRDAYNFLMTKTQRNVNGQLQTIKSVSITDNNHIGPDKFISKDSLKKQARRKRKIAILHDSLKHLLMQQRLDELEDNLGLHAETQLDEFGVPYVVFTPVIKNPGKSIGMNKKIEKYVIIHRTYIDPQFGAQVLTKTTINPLWLKEQERKQKENQISRVKKLLVADSLHDLQAANRNNVMQNIFEEYQRVGEPLTKRISNPFWIDTLLRMELHNQGIDQPFSYEVSTTRNDSVIFSTAMDKTGARPVFTSANTYQTRIFKEEVINDPGMIRLAFPQKNSLILGHMASTLGTTAGLLLILVFCFGYTLFSIIRQKKISEMKTDFINNMTHEFKTPVSTIMIASEALKDSDVAIDRTRIARLANIIYEENERLGSHIERVLNIAKIDKNDFKLEKKPLDVNEMISIVVDSMALKLQKCEADLVLELDADNAVINADELHFSNVLYNLIDNAIKYSGDKPQITITSTNKNGHVIIKVADKGIGMSRDQQSKIFEQFYRIPTGNVHNVKGFGLGLSYVNTVVKRLNGTINVRSEKDKGSEFELKFQGA
ncbi:sensor histidine kinase [Mucilaginibacter sp. UYCu711]|uniref:sensor histidine kinase n=1 Tax=Mucilaginibacter sp. UYCu711 TaxID=3156339 RepID=UPI003D20058A